MDALIAKVAESAAKYQQSGGATQESVKQYFIELDSTEQKCDKKGKPTQYCAKTVMLAHAQSLQKLLALWSSKQDDTVLGFLCIEMSTRLMNHLLTSKSIDDESKALKVVAFSVVSAMKMTPATSAILNFFTALAKCLVHTTTIGSPETRGKCIAHFLQTCGQICNKFRTAGQVSCPKDIQTFCGALLPVVDSDCYEDIKQSGLPAEDLAKLLSYSLDSFIMFSCSTFLDRKIASDVRGKTLCSYKKLKISSVRAVEQVTPGTPITYLLQLIIV
jgi:hypothetical protein